MSPRRRLCLDGFLSVRWCTVNEEAGEWRLQWQTAIRKNVATTVIIPSAMYSLLQMPREHRGL